MNGQPERSRFGIHRQCSCAVREGIQDMLFVRIGEIAGRPAAPGFLAGEVGRIEIVRQKVAPHMDAKGQNRERHGGAVRIQSSRIQQCRVESLCHGNVHPAHSKPLDARPLAGRRDVRQKGDQDGKKYPAASHCSHLFTPMEHSVHTRTWTSSDVRNDAGAPCGVAISTS